MRRDLKTLFISLFVFIQLSVSQAQNITWSEDIACIINSHCSPCHNSQNNLSFPLTSFEDVFNDRFKVEIYVSNRLMPPSLPDHDYSKFVGDKRLTQTEIELISEWVRGSALKGDTTKAPAKPVFVKPVSAISNPDLSFIATYKLKDSIDHHTRRCFVIPGQFGSGTKIKMFEVIPQTGSSVHAVYLFSDKSQIPVYLDSMDAANGYDHFYGPGTTTALPLYGWMPGSKPLVLPPGLAIAIDAGARLIVQVEYGEESAGQIDSTQINLKFDTTGSRNAVTQALLSHDKNLLNGPFIIPPEATLTFHERYDVTQATTFLSISPVAHHICDQMFVFAITPNKDTIGLLEIDDWEAGWSQGTYFFNKTVPLPAGSAIHAFGTYSNTILNNHDQEDSLHTVHSGLEEDHEEMIFNFTYLPYVSGDENILLDSATHFTHHQDCAPVHIPSTVTNAVPLAASFNMYPNPANASINFQFNDATLCSLSVIDVLGAEVYKSAISSAEYRLDVSSLKSGVYIVRIISSDGFITTKFIKE